MECSICHKDVRTYTIRDNKVICMRCLLKEREKKHRNKENNALYRASFALLGKQGNVLKIRPNMLLDDHQLEVWQKRVLNTDWVCIKYEFRNSPSDEWYESDTFGETKVVKDLPIDRLSTANSCLKCPLRQVCKAGKKNAGA